MKKKISSHQNPFIKQILNLEKERNRKENNIFVVEGVRELHLALLADFEVQTIIYSADFDRFNEVFENISEEIREKIEDIEVTESVFEKIAYRNSVSNIIALCKYKELKLSDLKLSNNPIIVVLESLEKPGNLGAILRTADAAGIDAVIVCDTQTNVYNPNVVRSSLGCLFTVQVAVAESSELIKWLKTNNLQIFATALTASVEYQTIDYTAACAIIMGSEAKGLTNIWLENSNANIKIPMRGKVDSMNVSVSTAITIFEAMRQRGFK